MDIKQYVWLVVAKIVGRLFSYSFFRQAIELKNASNPDFEYEVGVRLPYFFHSYNNFRATERAIEVPIVRHELTMALPSRVLEIGNVTKHYYDLFKDFRAKDTLDKYEIAYDVTNADIEDYARAGAERYDFIYSISTFEHMDTDGGRNSDVRKPVAPFHSVAFSNMQKVVRYLMAPNARFFVSFPLGYQRREIDRDLLAGSYRLLEANVSVMFFMRISEGAWEKMVVNEVDYFKVLDKCAWPDKAVLCMLKIWKNY